MKKYIIAALVFFIIGLVVWLSRPIDDKLYLKYPAQTQNFLYGKTIIYFVINEGNSKATNKFNISTNIVLESKNLPSNSAISSASYQISLLDEKPQNINSISTQSATIAKDDFVYSLLGNNIAPKNYRIKSTFEFTPECHFDQKIHETQHDFVAERTPLRRIESWFLVT